MRPQLGRLFKDIFCFRVNQLKDQIQTMTAQHKTDVQELNQRIKDMTFTAEENKISTQTLLEENQNLQSLLDESKHCNEELKSKITDLENSKPNPGTDNKYNIRFYLTCDIYL